MIKFALNMEKEEQITNLRGLLAISPIAVFLVLYLAVSIVIGDFYKMPLALAFIIASIWAVAITRRKSIVERIEIFTRGAAGSDVLYMIWIFIMAGAFSSLAKGVGSIEATVSLTLSVLPSQFLIPSLFLAACFISLSIGTSVGTVMALTPLALNMAQTTGGSVPFFVAVTLCGSFFGDNLSFISDTTIAATRSQKCKMNDKFKVNLWIAVPAAIIALVAFSLSAPSMQSHIPDSQTNPWLIVPYLLVIVTALMGTNVLLVLSLGIVSCIVIALTCTPHSLIDMCSFMGDGIDGMGNLIIVTLLASGLLELIRYNGGIQYIITFLTKGIRGQRGAAACISLVVSLVNLCTANNTVAIITVGQIANRISTQFNLDNRKVASLLDTCSCIVQCIIPYGAQTLLAAGIVQLAPVAFFPYLYYAWALAFMVALSIIFKFPRPRKPQYNTAKQ
ncbi:MAG: Na+/H+ antiporter NhaC family protein [Muribaculaceae bacterium]